MSLAASAPSAAPAVLASPLGDAGRQASSGPWWRHPMMWLVVGGPTLVVAASVITLTLAIRHADPVVNHSDQGGSAHVSAEDAGTDEHARTVRTLGTGSATSTSTSTTTTQAPDPALQPAMKARNHAATGGQEH
jgi:uncharacterized protein